MFKNYTLFHFLWIAFMVLTAVGLKIFSTSLSIEDIAETGGGNLFRQILILGFAVTFTWAVRGNIKSTFYLMGWPVILAVGWCGLTILWAPDPLLSLRRFVFLALTVWIVFAAVQKLGADTCLRLLAYTLAGLIIISVLAGPIVPGARHLAGQGAAELIGNWKGMFPHKNTAGFIAAITLLFAVYYAPQGYPKFWIGVAGTAIILLVMSASKTSMALVLPCMFFGWAYKKTDGNQFGSILLPVFIFMLVGFMGIGLWYNYDFIMTYLADPAAFTGRVAIWESLWYLIQDHMMFGAGYGSLWQAGLTSPLEGYAGGWISLVAHAHNGYLDVWASTGGVGLILIVGAFIVLPFNHVVHLHDLKLQSLLISLLIFLVLQNMLETALILPESFRWFLIVVIKAIINYKIKFKA